MFTISFDVQNFCKTMPNLWPEKCVGHFISNSNFSGHPRFSGQFSKTPSCHGMKWPSSPSLVETTILAPKTCTVQQNCFNELTWPRGPNSNAFLQTRYVSWWENLKKWIPVKKQRMDALDDACKSGAFFREYTPHLPESLRYRIKILFWQVYG